jgi:hypothetical protein
LLGAEFEAVGYGEQEWWFENPFPPFGTRAKGITELVGLGPMPYWEVVYEGDYETYLDDCLSWLPPELQDDPFEIAMCEAYWTEDVLIEDYDAVFKAAPANASYGDSGGPILKSRIGRLRSYGVASGIIYHEGDTDFTIERNFSVYSAFGPEAVHLVRSASICLGVPQEGECQDTTLTRCSGVDEGWPRVINTECSQTCVEAPAGAQCAPACTTDADCASIAANGVCDDQGVCTWSALDKCLAEPGEPFPFACFLCCLGQAMGGDFEDSDFVTCESACFGLPPEMPDSNYLRFRLPSFPQLEWPPR